MGKQRLDLLLVSRGLVASRERARALVLAGQVRVDGVVVEKAGASVSETADVALVQPAHPYVSRGGVKLAHALDVFGIAVDGRQALDLGASTGGFTDALLQRGAAHVVAVDVGRGQLDWTLRQDPRVTLIERLNARALTRARLPAGHDEFDLVTIDVSFISLRLVLPVVPPILRPDGDVVALVKPQFEAGRGEVGKKGIVRDEAVHARVLAEVTAAADRIGLTRMAETKSPITGMEGNQEYFVHLRRP